jgi:hypothetical protein
MPQEIKRRPGRPSPRAVQAAPFPDPVPDPCSSRTFRRTALALIVAIVPTFIVAACDGSARDAASNAPVVSDSAGVRIVSHAPPVRWEADVELREVLRIGVVEGPQELLFSNIVGGLIQSDRSVILADAASREIRHFAADGAFLRSHGREGRGPGEYQSIRGLGRCAPSGFTVFDMDWTMSVYDGAAAFVEKLSPRLEAGAIPYAMACDRSGRTATTAWSAEGMVTGYHVSMTHLRIFDADGAPVADLGERIGSERFGWQRTVRPHPLGRSTIFGFLDSDLIVTDGTFFGFERWDAHGRLAEIVRIENVPPPDADSAMAALLDVALANARDDDSRRRTRESAAAMVTGPPQPTFASALLVAPDRILIQELNTGMGARWFEFRSDGTPVGYLPLPALSMLLDRRGDYVLVAEYDDRFVPMAVLYELVPAERTST